jgi:hypothetical protein
LKHEDSKNNNACQNRNAKLEGVKVTLFFFTYTGCWVFTRGVGFEVAAFRSFVLVTRHHRSGESEDFARLKNPGG